MEGFAGIVVWVGGGKREEDADVVCVDGGPRFGREERGADGGGISPGAGRRGGVLVPPEALWAELSAGKAARRGCCVDGVVDVLARCAEFAAGKRGGCGFESWVDVPSVRLKEGIEVGCEVAIAFGVVGEVGLVRDGGGGGGGMSFRSSSTREGSLDMSCSTICGTSVFPAFSPCNVTFSLLSLFVTVAGASFLPLDNTCWNEEGFCHHVRSHVVGGCL